MIHIQTFDGEIFEDVYCAKRYEETIKPFIKCYCIEVYKSHRNPWYALVHTRDRQELFLKHWLFEKYGNPITFLGGFYNYNSIIKSYKYTECDPSDIDPNYIIARIEEDRVLHYWKDEQIIPKFYDPSTIGKYDYDVMRLENARKACV